VRAAEVDAVSGERQSIECEANSVDEAIARALELLGLARDEVTVEVLQEPRRSVLGFGRQTARVRVAARAIRDDDPESSAEGTDGRALLVRLLGLMGVESEVEASPTEDPGYTWLRMSTSAGGLLIGRHGQTLDALEYLVNRLAVHGEGDGRFLLDAEGYRERRSRELRETALRLAERARRTSRPQSMEPLGPRERRIVHVALSGDPTVATRSTGEGALRRVVIHPNQASKVRGDSRR
jgi:spoIIIJ-associated protein